MIRGLHGIKTEGKTTNFHLGVPTMREFKYGVDSVDDPFICGFPGHKAIMDVEWILARVCICLETSLSRFLAFTPYLTLLSRVVR